MRRLTAKCLAALLMVGLLVLPTTTARAGDRAAPPNSHAFGKSLTEWMNLYWQWLIGGGPDHVGRVTFLPQPNGDHVSGDFSYDDPGVLVGEAEVHLRPGTKFVLPVITWVGESYLSELHIPDDVPLDASVFTFAEVSLDGKRLIDASNMDDFYYGPTYFDTPIAYDEPTGYGANAAIFAQGIGFVHGPLSPGKHTLTLTSTIQIPEYGLGVTYVNTWTIVVK